MTEKLKTLKDIIEEIKFNLGSHLEGTAREVNVEVLRQEAVKWIKELDKQGEFIINPKEKHDEEKVQRQLDNAHEKGAQMDWIKHFFNITDEEIK